MSPPVEVVEDVLTLAKRLDAVPENHVPAQVDDFDGENWEDPYQVSHYAMSIFNYLKQREQLFPIGDYMDSQVCLSRWMRSLLVDWMVEVQESFELNHETLYLAVKLVDLYLTKVTVGRETLQLLGAASLFIASKYDVSCFFFYQQIFISLLKVCILKIIFLIYRKESHQCWMTFCTYVMVLTQSESFSGWR